MGSGDGVVFLHQPAYRIAFRVLKAGQAAQVLERLSPALARRIRPGVAVQRPDHLPGIAERAAGLCPAAGARQGPELFLEGQELLMVGLIPVCGGNGLGISDRRADGGHVLSHRCGILAPVLRGGGEGKVKIALQKDGSRGLLRLRDGPEGGDGVGDGSGPVKPIEPGAQVRQQGLENLSGIESGDAVYRSGGLGADPALLQNGAAVQILGGPGGFGDQPGKGNGKVRASAGRRRVHQKALQSVVELLVKARQAVALRVPGGLGGAPVKLLHHVSGKKLLAVRAGLLRRPDGNHGFCRVRRLLRRQRRGGRQAERRQQGQQRPRNPFPYHFVPFRIRFQASRQKADANHAYSCILPWPSGGVKEKLCYKFL